MRTIVLFSAIFMLFACNRSGIQGEKNEVKIILSPSFESASRATATAFEEGDQIGLYVLRSAENVKFVAAADGSVAASPALYYPDPKQEVTLCAYYPYISSVTDATKIPFTVSADLKKSDLCYARAEALPSAEAQALSFSHILSRVVVNVTLNNKIKSVTSVKFINTATDCTFDINTGVITLKAQDKSLILNDSVAIVPPQTFAAGEKMLEITVETLAGAIEVYYYTPLSATTLERGKVHSFSLSLGDNHNATLNGTPQISPWTGGTGSGIAGQKVSNSLIFHWVLGYSRAEEVDKIVFKITDGNNKTSEHTIDKPTYSNSSFSFDFTPAEVAYPYTINKVDFFKSTLLLQSCADLVAESVYQSGEHAVGVKDICNAVKIGNLWWATGNLVATNTTAPNNAGRGGARIGAPTDGGLYFRFGSLVGLKGGADGSGVGTAVATHNTGYWLRPEGHTTSTDWASAAYFSDESKTSGDLRDYVATDNAGNNGIGDACRYYLGAPWRLPTGAEYGDLCNKQYAISTNVGWAATGGKEVTTPLYGGWWNGTSSSTTSLASAVYFVGSGFMESTDGALTRVGIEGDCWSSSIGYAYGGLHLFFREVTIVHPQDNYNRLQGCTVRCVQGISMSLEAGLFSPVASSAHKFKLRLTGADGDSWTLAKSGAGAASFTPNRTSGVFGASTSVEVSVAANTAAAMRTVTFTLTSGEYTYDLTVEQAPAYVQIGALKWATGNLVATNTTAPNNAAVGGARIGAPSDGGLYFRFGSLIGLKGGADGSGVGQAVSTHNTGYWLRPTGHTASTDWASSAYFSDNTKTTGDFKTYHPTDNASNDGIGDACRYYLGAPWRLPTGKEFGDLCNKQYAISTNVGWELTGGKETKAPITTLYGGWWNGTASSTTTPNTAVYFVGCGYRHSTAGALNTVGAEGIYWSSSIGSATDGLNLYFHAGYVWPQSILTRVYGFPVRCVQ